MPVSPSWPGLKTVWRGQTEVLEVRCELSPVAVAPIQLAHTLVPSEATEATVAGGTAGPGDSSEAEENQREQVAHPDRVGFAMQRFRETG